MSLPLGRIRFPPASRGNAGNDTATPDGTYLLLPLRRITLFP